MKAINLYVSTVTDKSGKKFTAYETLDKDKNRVSVRFVQDGDKAPEKPCVIEPVTAWIDKRKRYPILRIKEYRIISDIETGDNKSELNELFGD